MVEERSKIPQGKPTLLEVCRVTLKFNQLTKRMELPTANSWQSYYDLTLALIFSKGTEFVIQLPI
ncbi:MAG: hypothetical protein V7L20_11210 [Nostoc sp.]|uniref:hypothetical protein n=1 Tax=Nostoc sp. TaxID=1180 RepID=UPI002FF5C087